MCLPPARVCEHKFYKSITIYVAHVSTHIHRYKLTICNKAAFMYVCQCICMCVYKHILYSYKCGCCTTILTQLKIFFIAFKWDYFSLFNVVFFCSSSEGNKNLYSLKMKIGYIKIVCTFIKFICYTSSILFPVSGFIFFSQFLFTTFIIIFFVFLTLVWYC